MEYLFPLLNNIFREVESDLGKPMPQSGRLERWANQGVLLINAILTIRAHQADSHRNKGWEEFTDAVIRHLNEEREQIVFMLWGVRSEKRRFYRYFPPSGVKSSSSFSFVC